MPPCYCIVPSVSDSFKSARAVFQGEVTEVIEPKIGGENSPDVDHAYTIKFKVHQMWKGLAPDTKDFNVLWTTHCYECPPLPHIKDTYLVYGNPIRGNETLSFVGWCNRTMVVPDDSSSSSERDPYQDMKELDIITKRAFIRRRV
jgi:hypothetical protein